MKEGKRNLPASVAARLLNRARKTGHDYQSLLADFCLERFLFRLGESRINDRFVLKGAMLLRVWSDQPYRATRDLDMLRRGNGSAEAIREDIQAICAAEVSPDAVEFDPVSAQIEPIRPEDEYAGTRIILPAGCGTARLRLQIDMGLGDSVWPTPQILTYPALLEFPPPRILAYPREAVIAEKLEAIVVLGNRNSRIKDFFDLHHLASVFTFERPTVAEAIRRTFYRRNTPVPAEEPFGLTPAFWEDPSRAIQVRAFARRAGLPLTADTESALLRTLRLFLLPILQDVRQGMTGSGTWQPGGPWQP